MKYLFLLALAATAYAGPQQQPTAADQILAICRQTEDQEAKIIDALQAQIAKQQAVIDSLEKAKVKK